MDPLKIRMVGYTEHEKAVIAKYSTSSPPGRELTDFVKVKTELGYLPTEWGTIYEANHQWERQDGDAACSLVADGVYRTFGRQLFRQIDITARDGYAHASAPFGSAGNSSGWGAFGAPRSVGTAGTSAGVRKPGLWDYAEENAKKDKEMEAWYKSSQNADSDKHNNEEAVKKEDAEKKQGKK